LSTTPEFNALQLAAARASAWHQSGDALLTFDATKDWITERGLLLFAPRAQQLPAPAPSLVEATLGAANAAPTLVETETARGLVARLTGEGLALPLNLMGVPSDSPDFVVSAQVFSYIFTLRGDKAWKLPPSTSGAVSVSPLGLHIFEVLTTSGPMTAQELASELGREVTGDSVAFARDGQHAVGADDATVYEVDQGRGECWCADGAFGTDLAVSGAGADGDRGRDYDVPFAADGKVKGA
jgi:hypothetical protein